MTCCLWSNGLRTKKPPAPVQVPCQGPLAPSVTSVMSVADDKGDNQMILGAQISWHLPYSLEKPQNTSTRRSSMKAVRPVMASNGLPNL